jgi:hypothetical protein
MKNHRFVVFLNVLKLFQFCNHLLLSLYELSIDKIAFLLSEQIYYYIDLSESSILVIAEIDGIPLLIRTWYAGSRCRFESVCFVRFQLTNDSLGDAPSLILANKYDVSFDSCRLGWNSKSE